ncbi:MAG: helix-turn-helix domain-containing protein [Gammaproteobacteria bacterium]|nr:helix-turn-helix domain-containing protein [Gammaproteobacteria bacterium]
MASIPMFAIYGLPYDANEPEFLHIEEIGLRAGVMEGRVEPHAHPELLQLMFALNGSCELQIEQRRHSLAGPCMLYIPGGKVHSFNFSDDSIGWVVTASEHVFTPPAGAPEAETMLRLMRTTMVRQFEKSAPEIRFFSQILARMTNEFSASNPARKLALESLFTLVMIEMARMVDADDEAEAYRDAHYIAFDRFRRMLEHNLRDHMNIERYANELGLSSTKLNRICRRYAGRTAHEMIQGRLLLEAQRLLIYTAANATQVALELGFKDPAYFNRFFRKETGMTPLAFRASQRPDG